jgi:hypothetical protein
MVGVQLMLERVVGMASQLSQGYSTVKVAPMFKPAAPLQGIGRASHILSHWGPQWRCLASGSAFSASLPRLGCDVMRAGTACCCSPAQLMSVCPLGTKPLCPLPLRCLPSKQHVQVWRADESRTFGFRIHNAIVASLPKRHAACDQHAHAHTLAHRDGASVA